jgi:hypothetical protein
MKLIGKVTFSVQSYFILCSCLTPVIIFQFNTCDSTLQRLMKSGQQENIFVLGSVLKIIANSHVELKRSFLYMPIK